MPAAASSSFGEDSPIDDAPSEPNSPARREDVPPSEEDRALEDDKGKVFLRLFLRAERRIYAYLFTLWPRRADCDDLLQEVSALLWDKFDPARPPNDFVAWGCRIAYFKVLEHRKKLSRSRVMFSQELLERLAETALEQSAALQLDERREALERCLEHLPARDRELLAARFADDATTQSAAVALGRSTEAVYKAVQRVRRALLECVRNRLAWEGG